MGGEIHLYDVIRRPVITEKSEQLTEAQNVYVFEVNIRATKPMIKNAVEAIFDVDVLKVRTAIMPAKRGQRWRKIYTRKKMWKKAYVTVMPGQSIDLHSI